MAFPCFLLGRVIDDLVRSSQWYAGGTREYVAPIIKIMTETSGRSRGKEDRMSNADGSCGCGRIDVHAHFLPECYTQALKKAGLTTLDGGFPVPAWSAQAALETMARQNI